VNDEREHIKVLTVALHALSVLVPDHEPTFGYVSPGN